MATTMEGLRRQIEDAVPTVEHSLLTAEDIQDQLDYLLNKTVRRNYSIDSPTVFLSGVLRENEITHVPKHESVSTDANHKTRMTEKYINLKSEFRNKHKRWWTFSDVVPTWEENIKLVFNGKVKESTNKTLTKTLLTDGRRCIMGESWGGAGWGTCSDCEWLGGEGLRLFANKGSRGMINPDGKEGFIEYQMRYEYHWNKYHHDVGDSESKAPNLIDNPHLG